MTDNNMGKRIRELRLSNQLTLEQVAQYVGVGKSTVRKWETGMIANMKRDKIASLAAVLKTTPAYLMGWDENTSLPKGVMPVPQMVKKPRLGTIACGKPVLAVEEADQWDDVPVGIDCDFTLECKGDSMINARIFPGDIVYIKSQPVVDNGEIAAVLIGEEATLKKVYYTPGSNRIVLQACNPMYSDMVFSDDQLNDIQILGKAVWFMSKVRI